MSATDAIGHERLEALLRGEEPAGASERRRAALVAELRAGTLRAPERLRARVLAAGPAPVRVRLPAGRRLALVVVLVAAVFALAAALADGLLRSGGSPQSASTLRAVTVAGSAASGSTAHMSVPNVAPAAPALGASPLRLQHADATLAVQVADADALSQATGRATRIASALGGWAQSVNYGSAKNGRAQAQLDLRVPTAKVQTAVERLGALGTILSQELSVQDLQQQLAARSQQIAQLRRRVAALAKAVAVRSLPDAQRVLLRIKLSEARRSLTQALNARKGTLAAGATSDVELTLSVKPKHGAAAPPRGRLGRMLRSAAGFLALEGLVVLYALVVLAPVVLVAALAWWLVRERRRRQERRLLAA